jgi:hypothetical protein
MSGYNFKIGDRVKMKETISVFLASANEKGVVIDGPETIDGEVWYGVEFDNKAGGHDCNGKGKLEHCAWLKEEHLELIISPILKIKDWIKEKNDEPIADGIVYLIENKNYEFVTKENTWTSFVTLALRFRTKLKAQMYLHFNQEEIGNPYAKVTEHIFTGPTSFVNKFLTQSED